MYNSRFAWLIGIVAVAAGAISWQAHVAVEATTAFDNQTRPAGRSVSDPLPGPIYLENDSYYWLRMAERMNEEGTWRIRDTHSDNAPFGRPVYWSQSIAWLMHALSWWPGFSGQASPLTIASFWINPLLQILCVLALVLTFSRFDWRAALAGAFLLVSVGDVGWTFSALRPDHQSLQAMFLLFLILPLLTIGFGFGTPTFSGNRVSAPLLPFVLSGLSGGAGLWISAAAMMPVFIILAVAVCGLTLMGSLSPENPKFARKGWIYWGASAGITSLCFWLLEFFPNLARSRLEVNNPAFALWIFGLGLGIAFCFGFQWGERASRWKDLAGLIAVAGLCLLLPGTILFGPAEWYLPRNIFMDRLHNFIMEFYTYPNFTKGQIIPSLAKSYQFLLPFAAFLVFPAFAAPNRAMRMTSRILILITLGLLAMAFRQIRWFALFAPTLCVTVAFSTFYIVRWMDSKGRFGQMGSIVILCALCAQSWFFFHAQLKSFEDVTRGKSILNEMVAPVLNKRVALALAGLEDKPTAIFSDPDLAPAIQYFTRIPVVSSFYWENVDGARDLALFLADTTGEDAFRIAKQRGLSHVIVPSGPLLANYVYYMVHGQFDRNKALDNLAAALAGVGRMKKPEWLESDINLDSIGKMPFSYRGEIFEQYLNIYKVNLDGIKKAPEHLQ